MLPLAIEATYRSIWYYNSFDDSQWDKPSRVSPAVASCVTQQMGGWAGFPAYWGKGNLSGLLIRQHFTVPKASTAGAYGYAGTTVDHRSYAKDTDAWLNQQPILVAESNDFSEVSPGVLSLRACATVDRIPVGLLIQAGDNVLAIKLETSTNTHTRSGATCNAISFTITTQLHKAWARERWIKHLFNGPAGPCEGRPFKVTTPSGVVTTSGAEPLVTQWCGGQLT